MTRRGLPWSSPLGLTLEPYRAARAAVVLTAALQALAVSAAETPVPVTAQQVQTQALGYKKCQEDAIAKYREKKLSVPQIRRELAICRDRYPGGGMYATCKEQVAAGPRGKDPKLVRERLEKCKKLLASGTFNTVEPLPFFTFNDTMYFAGIGLNEPVRADKLRLPGFNCGMPRAAVATPSSRQFLLFGNHPYLFPALADAAGQNKLDKATSGQKGEMIVDGLGKMTAPPSKKDTIVLFPMAPCSYTGDGGPVFRAVNIHYLVDPDTRELTPYAGIAFYQPKQTAADVAELARRAAAAFGTKAPTLSRHDKVVLIAQAKIREFDRDNDPKNLCRSPREHTYLGTIKGRIDNPKIPDYLLIANIKNLCEFGDRVAQRFVKR